MDQHEVNGLLDRNQNQDHAQQCEWDEATKKSNVRKESCSWREDEGGCWFSDCGDGFVFSVDGPRKNAFKFCPFCGKPIKELAWNDTDIS